MFIAIIFTLLAFVGAMVWNPKSSFASANPDNDRTDTDIPNELKQRAFAKDAFREALQDIVLSPFMGEGPDSMVQIKNELEKQPGDRIMIRLVMQLKNSPVVGDAMLEGNEEALEYQSYYVDITQMRNAVRLVGKFSEQTTAAPMRNDCKVGLKEWLVALIENSLFRCGAGFTMTITLVQDDEMGELVRITGWQLTNPPTPNRVIFAGKKKANSEITATDVMTLDLISRAKRLARTVKPKLRPIRINGKPHYAVFLHDYQIRDLKKDPLWFQAQANANVRGEDNPIFSGAAGLWDGVIIYEATPVVLSNLGKDGLQIGHALFLGAQGLVFARANQPDWFEKVFDYGNKFGVALGQMMGFGRPQFGPAGKQKEDFGCINIITAAVADSDLTTVEQNAAPAGSVPTELKIPDGFALVPSETFKDLVAKLTEQKSAEVAGDEAEQKSADKDGKKK